VAASKEEVVALAVEEQEQEALGPEVSVEYSEDSS
jgi:hypothetical protein